MQSDMEKNVIRDMVGNTFLLHDVYALIVSWNAVFLLR